MYPLNSCDPVCGLNPKVVVKVSKWITIILLTDQLTVYKDGSNNWDQLKSYKKSFKRRSELNFYYNEEKGPRKWIALRIGVNF